MWCQRPEYGDASACLKLRTPVIRRDPQFTVSRCVPSLIYGNPA
jgi:hypothetical protein